jgi:hypothetical protein
MSRFPKTRELRCALAAGAFVLMLLLLAATSSPVSVGDGDEYLRLAERIGHLRAPGGVSRHFWLYPALASPFVRLASAAGVNPLTGFTILNVALLAAAFPVVLRRIGGAAALLLMVGPMLWWLDKPHSELFTFSMLAIAFSLVRDAPWWTLVTVALAGMQNLPIAAALPVTAGAALAMHPAWLRDRRWWTGVAVAVLLLAGVLGYNLLHSGSLAPLLPRGRLALPSVAEIGVPLWDPNLGLLPNFPGLALVVVALVVLLLRAAPRSLLTADIIAAGISTAAFVFGASQAININSGGTPGMSRYATWLIPLAIPLLAQARESLRPRARRWMIPVAALSAMGCLAVYHPRLPERTGRPTLLARTFWTRYPSLDNPLPEVFVERLNGLDEDWVPAATAGCEKVLLSGRGRDRAIWPMPCPPVPPPADCFEPARLCYANRTGSGYRFVVLPRRDDRLRVRRENTWSVAAESAAARLFSRLRWPDLGPATLVESSDGVASVAGLQSSNGALVCLGGIGPSASLLVRLPAPMTAMFVQPETGEPMAQVHVPGGGSRISVPRPQDGTGWILFLQ